MSTTSGHRERVSFRSLGPVIAPISLGLADQILIATALPLIGAEFGSPQGAAVVSSSYLAAAAISVAVYGRLGDIHGPVWTLRLALTLYAVGSLLCFFAPSMDMLAASRAIQGLGGGGLIALSHSVVARRVSTDVYRRMQSTFSGIAFATNAAGPMLAALLMAAFGWHSMFLATACIGIGALAVLAGRSDTDHVPPANSAMDWKSIALLGLLIAALTLGVEAIDGPPAIVCALAALAIFSAAGMASRARRVPDSLFPARLFVIASVWRTNLMIMLHGGALGAMLIATPLLFRDHFALSIPQIGTLLAAVGVTLAGGGIAHGLVMGGTGWLGRLPTIGLTVIATCFALLAVCLPSISLAGAIAIVSVAVFFLGGVFPTAQVMMRESAPRDLISTAASSIQLARSLGSAIGAGACGAVLTATMSGGVVGAYAAGYSLAAAFALAAAATAWTIPLRKTTTAG